MKRVVRLRRCSLSVPGDSEKMLAKAQNINCDQIILDLEDSVAFESKARARHNISEAIGNKSFVARTISVRINATDTEHCHTDLIDLVSRAGKQLDTVILAKTRRPADVQFVDPHIRLWSQRKVLACRYPSYFSSSCRTPPWCVIPVRTSFT